MGHAVGNRHREASPPSEESSSKHQRWVQAAELNLSFKKAEDTPRKRLGALQICAIAILPAESYQELSHAVAGWQTPSALLPRGQTGSKLFHPNSTSSFLQSLQLKATTGQRASLHTNTTEHYRSTSATVFALGDGGEQKSAGLMSEGSRKIPQVR